MITTVAHACYLVSDLEKSITFYRDGLGLTPAFDFIDKEGKRYGIYLKAGGRTFVELFAGKPEPRAEGQSFGHICLEVDDINTTVTDLKSRGVDVGEISLGMDNSYQAWFSDPDGNRFELMQYTPTSWQTPHVK